MLAATQMEKDHEMGSTSTTSTTSKTALIKRNIPQPDMAASPFSNYKIGSIGTININIYKQ